MSPPASTKPTLWERNKDLLEEYGMIAVATVVGLFILEMVVLVAMLRMGVDLQPFVGWVHDTTGWDVSAVLEAAGHIGIAYAVTRVLKPIQIVVALVLTPVVASIWHRMRGTEAGAPAGSASSGEEPQEG